MTKTTKASEIRTSISDDIVQGRRAPGSALDETVLAREFGVSRTPIREAIRQLEASGLVEARPHRGAVVCAVPADRVADMLVVLVELEALCARLSATAMTERQRAALRELQDGTAPLARDDRRDDYESADRAFHDAVSEGSQNPFLDETAQRVRRRLSPFRRALFDGEGLVARSFEGHGRILLAIEARDAAAAADAMRRHLGPWQDADGGAPGRTGGSAARPKPRRARAARA